MLEKPSSNIYIAGVGYYGAVPPNFNLSLLVCFDSKSHSYVWILIYILLLLVFILVLRFFYFLFYIVVNEKKTKRKTKTHIKIAQPDKVIKAALNWIGLFGMAWYRASSLRYCVRYHAITPVTAATATAAAAFSIMMRDRWHCGFAENKKKPQNKKNKLVCLSISTTTNRKEKKMKEKNKSILIDKHEQN